MLEIITFVLGMVDTNTYLVADESTQEAVVIDPAWQGEYIVEEARQRGWSIQHIWLTHAHFDHIAGVTGVAKSLNPVPPVALHPDDLGLWNMQGGAGLFGFHIDPGPRPSILLRESQKLKVGDIFFEVRHAPGHSPGHVVFFSEDEKVAFCGDVIFAGGIGRTDLPGGNYYQLLNSIRTQIFSMPDETRLLSGHGPETSVAEERRYNPFLTELVE